MAAFFPGGRGLAVEALVIGVLIVVTGFLVYHFTVHKIVNHRPLGGPNVDVVSATSDQSQAAFVIDPTDAKHIFGASNDPSLEVVRAYDSATGGATWHRSNGPAVPGGSCAHGEPSVAIGRGGREYLAFLASPYCGDTLTPYLVVTSRSGPRDRWTRLARVAPATWKYGFDDAPDLVADRRDGRLYVAWTRSLSKQVATVVVSSSSDDGKTWSAPQPLAADLDHPHHVRLAIAANGDLYAAGIDAKLGVWVTRSTDGGSSFAAPSQAARLLANPAAGCALTVLDPLPRELSACEGPDPTLSVSRDRVYVVYSDVGANGTPDIFAVGLDLNLKRLYRAQVNPADTRKTQQFMPVSSVDPSTGVLWACWYDTTFDPHAHRAWFTCAASRDGRRWTAPVRAASEPTATDSLFGTLGSSGLYPAVAASGGTAHAFWADGRVIANSSDIFTAAIPAGTAFAAR